MIYVNKKSKFLAVLEHNKLEPRRTFALIFGVDDVALLCCLKGQELFPIECLRLEFTFLIPTVTFTSA